jgi:hypothetical protein
MIWIGPQPGGPVGGFYARGTRSGYFEWEANRTPEGVRSPKKRYD